MKTLTNIQIKHIDDFLIQHYKIYFVDLKAEILDHISSDIEEMLNQNISYEAAFVKVMASWDSQLQTSKSYYKGVPKLIARQWLLAKWKHIGKSALFGILTTLSISVLLVLFRVEEDALNKITSLLFFWSISVFLIFCLFCYYQIQTHSPTTAKGCFLRIELKRNALLNAVVILNILLNQIFKFNNIYPWYALITGIFVFSVLYERISWYLAYKKEKIFQTKWDLIK